MQQGGEERAVAQLGDRHLQLSRRGGHGLGAGTVAAGGAVLAALVAAGADLHGCFRVDQVLHPGLQQAAEQLVACRVGIIQEFLDQGRQGRLVVGHRGSFDRFLAESEHPR